MGSSSGMKNRDLLPEPIFKIDNTAAAREFLAEVMEEPSYKIKGNTSLPYIGLCSKRYGISDPYPSYSRAEPNNYYKLEELKDIYTINKHARNWGKQGIPNEDHGIMKDAYTVHGFGSRGVTVTNTENLKSVFDPSTINETPTTSTKETTMTTDIIHKYKNVNFATPVLFRGECIKDYTKHDYMSKLRLLDTEIRGYADLEGTQAVDDIVTALKIDRERLAGYFNEHMNPSKGD